MSYSIIRYDGTSKGTIADGTVDTTHTSLTLIGRNYSNYGQIMVSNLVNLLENFSRSTSPANPLSGQLWWDSGNNILKVNVDGINWKVIGSCTVADTAPTSPTAGDLWWKLNAEQLYIYSALTATWILVGPSYPRGAKSGAIYETLSDGMDWYPVVSLYVNNKRVSIFSNDNFTPNVSIIGFTTLKPGTTANVALGSVNLWGTANNASYLGNVPAATFWRNDQNNSGTGTLTVQNDNGITVGASGQLTFNLSGTDASITNNANGGDINILATVSGITNRYIYINGGNGAVEVAANPITSLGIATKQYVDAKFTNTALLGVPTAPTPGAGDSSTQIATTAFVVSGLSGLLKNKIYQGNSYLEIVDAGSGSANLVLDGTSVLTASTTGVALGFGAQAITQAAPKGNITAQSGNAAVATTGYVRQVAQYWNGSAKFVSTSAPGSGDGDDGDIWFQIAS